jgi:hypothetical protein
MESEWIMMFRRIRQPCGGGFSNIPRVDPISLPREKCEDRQWIDSSRAVLRTLIGVQCISGRKLLNPFLFSLYSETDSAADSKTHSTGHPILTENIRRAITHGSDNLPMRIVWIEDNNGGGGEPEGEYIPSGGVVVRFTGIRQYKTDIHLAKGRIHRWGMEPRGFEFGVEKRGGFWR